MAKQTGRKVPDRVANKPELNENLAFYFRVFMELTNDRQMGFGVGPIPTMTILEYCAFWGIEGQDLEDVLFFVRALDEQYVSYNADKGSKGFREPSKSPSTRN